MNLSIEELKALRVLVKAYIAHQFKTGNFDVDSHAELLGRLVGEIKDREKSDATGN